MVKTLTLTCPHCQQVAEIFLSTNASVIILDCPSCLSPVMYFEKKIYLLSKNQIDAIKDTTQNKNIMKMLDRIAHPEHSVLKTIKKTNHGQNVSAISEKQIGIEQALRPAREKYICDDDITNLRIELALCSDAQQFIDSL